MARRNFTSFGSVESPRDSTTRNSYKQSKRGVRSSKGSDLLTSILTTGIVAATTFVSFSGTANEDYTVPNKTPSQGTSTLPTIPIPVDERPIPSSILPFQDPIEREKEMGHAYDEPNTSILLDAVAMEDDMGNAHQLESLVSSNTPKKITPSKPTNDKQTKPNKKPERRTVRESDVDLLARLVLGEAGDCSYRGMVAVASTVPTRANDGKKWNGETIEEVILKHSKDGVYQYSCFNKNDPNRNKVMNPTKFAAYTRCLEVAQKVLEGKVENPFQGADHYYSPEGMRAIRINKIMKEYRADMRKLEKSRPAKNAESSVKRKYWQDISNRKSKLKIDLKRARTEEPPEPYWARSMIKLGSIGKGAKKHIFYRSR